LQRLTLRTSYFAGREALTIQERLAML